MVTKMLWKKSMETTALVNIQPDYHTHFNRNPNNQEGKIKKQNLWFSSL